MTAIPLLLEEAGHKVIKNENYNGFWIETNIQKPFVFWVEINIRKPFVFWVETNIQKPFVSLIETNIQKSFVF